MLVLAYYLANLALLFSLEIQNRLLVSYLAICVALTRLQCSGKILFFGVKTFRDGASYIEQQ